MKNNKDLLKHVQEALAKETELSAYLENIYVLVNDGAVIMAGSVPDQRCRTIAGKVVSAIPGVALLINDLKIEPLSRNRVGVQIDWAKGSMTLSRESLAVA